MSETRYIDDDELPFTEDELCRAFALLKDDHAARDAAHLLAELLSDGTYDGGWSISDEVFAALALLSDDLRERVDAYMRRGWEGRRQLMLHEAVRREGLPRGTAPPPSAIRAADEQLAEYVTQWLHGSAALAEWVRRRQAGEPVADEPPRWPGSDQE